MAPDVPKFTSFRPKPKESPDPPKEPKKPEKSEKAEKSSKEKPSKEREPKGEKGRPSPTSEKAPSKLFFSDRRGDPNILRYGCVDPRDVPAYRCIGFGCVLGLPPDRKIDRDLSTDKEIVIALAKPRRQERLLKDNHATRDSRRVIRFVKQAEVQHDVDSDFVPLSKAGKRKRDEEENPDMDYREIERNAPTEPEDPDAEFESATEVSPADAEATQKNAALVRRTREHPEDLQAWLELIDHQEAMMKIDRLSNELSPSNKRHLADIRISTYEQALRLISNPEGQLKLYLGLMAEAGRVWDDEKLAAKWSDLLTKFPQSVDLWIKYLDSIQSGFATFKYENCRAAYFKCLQAFQSVSNQEATEFRLYILVRLTSLIQQAGYQELSLAVWQALLEHHLMGPPTGKHVPLEQLPRLFGEFWESEVARIGELGAKGWRNFNADDTPPVDPSALNSPNPSDPVFEDFRKRETESMSKLKYPGRTTDEVGEDDAFHTVLYSDIEEFLRIIPLGVSKLSILGASLLFCGLPPCPRSMPDEQRYLLDPFLHSQFTSSNEIHGESNSFPQAVAKYNSCPVNGFQMTTELLFDKGFPETPTTVDTAFVRRVLQFIAADANSDEGIGEYLLALELKYFPTEAFKTAKRLLKARPASLRLYNAYGIVESRRGNSAKADQVFSAALSMHKGDIAFSTPGSLELFNSWVWEALRRGDKKEALWRLMSPEGFVAKEPQVYKAGPDPAALLRARTVLNETNERALLGRDYALAVTSTSLSALLAYLTSGENPKSTLTIHNNLSTWFTKHGLSTSWAEELNAQSVAQFLAFHSTNAPIVKPSLLRTTLEPLISQFPNNTVLLSLYAANEARFSIDDRVRMIMHQQVLSNNTTRSIIGWTFAIHYETLKGELAGSTIHSIRALYKKAEDDVGAHCPALWKQHVLFELDQARKERAKRPAKRPRKDGKKRKDETRVEEAYRRVKEMFFMGLTKLPWCKDFMMMAFTELGQEVLSREEMRKVYNVMVEKELRLYVEIEDGSG